MSFNITPVASGYEEIHPYSAMNIVSVEINTSLIMMKEWPIDSCISCTDHRDWLTDSSISQFSCLTVLPPTKAEIFLLGVLSTICVWDYVVVGWKFELNFLVVGLVNRISGRSVLSSLDGFSVLFWTSIHPCHHHHQYQGERILK